MLGLESIARWHTVTDYQEETDAESVLLQSARVGDRAALERLLARHEPALYRLCRGILGHTQDAEDAVQETLLRALRALPRFRGDASLRTWLSRIALHLCLDWKRARRPADAWEALTPDLQPTAPSPETAVLRQIHLWEALGALQPRHRAVLVLKEVEDWRVPEIATAMGWNERRVYYELTLAHRALAEWRQRSADEGE